MALTATEQKLLDFAKGILPTWFTSSEREMEFLGAAAKIMGQAQAQVDDWFGNALIGDAVGPVSFDPDWLNQHAVDRGTARQDGETDVALRARIRGVEDALTRSAILIGAQAIVDAEAIVGTVAMVELKRDAAFFQTSTSDAGVAGAFTAPDAGNVQRFTPVAGFNGLPFRSIEEARTHKLTTILATGGGNNVTDAVITGLDGDAITFVNAGGFVEAADAGVVWVVKKYDRDDNLLDGFDDSYFGDDMAPSDSAQADRMADRNSITLILPFGCTDGTRSSVLEMLRQKKGAGLLALVECRANP
jgi:hypothetical protein